MGVVITNNSKYEGQIVNGLKHGKGVETFKNKDTY
jgi:hypothetical protein